MGLSIFSTVLSTAPFGNPDSLIVFNDANFARYHSSKKYAPHTAVVIDPFYSSVPSDSRYPGLDSYYTHSGGGSSMIEIGHIGGSNMENIVSEVGTANGDNIDMHHMNVDNVRRFYVTYCSQSRQGSIDMIYIKNAQTVFFNDGIGAPPSIRNVSGAGFIRETLDAVTQESKITMDNCQFEGLWRIGRAVGFPTSFKQVQFKFDNRAGLPKPNIIYDGSSGNTSFDGCTLVYFANGQVRNNLAFSQGATSFGGCHFQSGIPYVIYSSGGIQNFITHNNSRFNNYRQSSMTTGNPMSMYIGGESLTLLHGETTFRIDENEEFLIQGGNGHSLIGLGNYSFTQTTDRTKGYFILPDSSDRIRVSDPLITGSSVFPTSVNYENRGVIGSVESISGDTIYCKDLTWDFPFNTSMSVNISAPNQVIFGVYGDTEIGNDTIKNVYGFVGNSWYRPFLSTAKFNIPGFKYGSYMKASSISTPGYIVMSTKATATNKRVPIQTTVPMTHRLRSSTLSGFSANKVFTKGEQIVSTNPNSDWVSATVDTAGKWASGLYPVFNIQSRIQKGDAEGQVPIWNNAKKRYEPGSIASNTTVEGTTPTATSGTTLLITHNLGSFPTAINITPAGDIGNWHLSGINTTTMTLNYETVTPSSVTIYWQVE